MPPSPALYLVLDQNTLALLAVRESKDDALLFAGNTASHCEIYAIGARYVPVDDSAQKAVEAENARRALEPITGDTLPMVEVERRLAKED